MVTIGHSAGVRLVVAVGVWLVFASVGHSAAEVSAKGYLGWLDSAIERQAEQMAAFSASADAAAAAFVANGRWSIGTLGQRGFASEAGGRAGGIIRIHGPHQVAERNWRGIVLVGLINHDLDGLLKAAKAKAEQGCHVVAFGTAKQKAAAAEAGVAFDSFIETGATETDGLVRSAKGPGGEARWLLPTQHVGNMVALWTWTGEFIAAVTRRGKMTPVYIAYAVPGGQEWRKTIGMTKFHESGLRVEPVEAGVLGKAFIAALRADLAALAKTQLESVKRTAALAIATRADGGRLYAFLHGHAFMDCLGGPHDPGDFGLANRGWVKLARGVEPEAGDMIFCVGFDQYFDGEWFEHFAPRMRERGVRLAWSIGANNPLHDYDRPESEPLIDQGWPFGDASVTVPGYPVKILPTSGILGQSTIWMVQAEMMALEAE